MKRTIVISLILSAISFFWKDKARAQGMVFNNNAFVVISSSAFLVVNESSPSGILTQGSGGNIISEDEFSRVKWNISNSIGTYILPFTKTTGIKIPLTVDISAGGTGSGAIVFSTYAGADWQNSNYLPAGVNNMGNPDSSAFTLDRFWLIDAQNYLTKPALNAITFTYDDTEWSASGNTIIESDLSAQWFNTNTNLWLRPNIGTNNSSSNTVITSPVPPNDFYRAWTLAQKTEFLACNDLFIPTAFSPNKDGHNDRLFVRGNCISKLEFFVYNRWGEQVFYTDNILNGWDGTYKGKSENTSVFAYYMQATLISGEKISMKGNISLLR